MPCQAVLPTRSIICCNQRLRRLIKHFIPNRVGSSRIADDAMACARHALIKRRASPPILNEFTVQRSFTAGFVLSIQGATERGFYHNEDRCARYDLKSGSIQTDWRQNRLSFLSLFSPLPFFLSFFLSLDYRSCLVLFQSKFELINSTPKEERYFFLIPGKINIFSYLESWLEKQRPIDTIFLYLKWLIELLNSIRFAAGSGCKF